MPYPSDVVIKAHAIKLLAMDVDGVMTNGDVIYTDAGHEIKVFNVKDGHGIAMYRRHGGQVALITGRNSTITQRRAEELGIPYVFQGVKTKLPVLRELITTLGLQLGEVAYIGDDTPDIPILEAVGLAACPADAVEKVKRVCHYTTQAPGGRGAVREVIDILLGAQLSQVEQHAAAMEASPA